MRYIGEETVKSFTKEELEKLVLDVSKRWLAHDGIWFQCTERARGMEEAIQRDGEAWDGFSKSETRRIMRLYNIPPGGGFEALKKVLRLRAYSFLNTISIEEPDENTLIYTMVTCRVQATRISKGLPAFECKSVGILEMEGIISVLDPRLKVRCLVCRPDPGVDDKELNCRWEFTLEKE